MARLNEAVRTTDPANEQRQQDVSGVIDEVVRMSTAKKLHEAAKQAELNGSSPKEAVYNLLVEAANDQELVATNVPYLLAELTAIASAYVGDLNQSDWRVQGAANGAQ